MSQIKHLLSIESMSRADIEQICREARQHKFYSVCVNPTWVSLARQLLDSSGVKVCCVVGFPLGAQKPETKAMEARVAALEAYKAGLSFAPNEETPDLFLLTLAAQAKARIGSLVAIAEENTSGAANDPVRLKKAADSLVEASLRYVIAHRAVSTVLIGIATLDQFEAAARAVNKGPLSREALDRVAEIQRGLAGEPR